MDKAEALEGAAEQSRAGPVEVRARSTAAQEAEEAEVPAHMAQAAAEADPLWIPQMPMREQATAAVAAALVQMGHQVTVVVMAVEALAAAADIK